MVSMKRNYFIIKFLYIESIFIYILLNSWSIFLIYFLFQSIVFFTLNFFDINDILLQYLILNNIDYLIIEKVYNTDMFIQLNFIKTNELNRICSEINGIVTCNPLEEESLILNDENHLSSVSYDKIPKSIFSRFFPVLDISSHNYLWKFKQDSAISLEIRDLSQKIEITPDKVLSKIMKELYSYTLQKEKFLNIIDNINKGTENFYPPNSITEFKEDIILIDSLIKELNSQAKSLIYNRLRNNFL